MGTARKKLALRRRKRSSLFGKIRSVLGWTVVLLLLAAILGGGILYRRADSEISRVVEVALNENFPQTNVSFDTARLDATRGLRLYAVQWRLPDASKDAPPFLQADEIYVECPLEIKKIVSRQFELQRVVVAHPVLNLGDDIGRAQGDLQKLVPAQTSGASPNLSVEINDATLNFAGTSISGINLRLEPARSQKKVKNAPETSPIEPSSSPQEPVDDVPTPNFPDSPHDEIVRAVWNVPTASRPNVGFVNYQPLQEELDPTQEGVSSAEPPSNEIDRDEGENSSIAAPESDAWIVQLSASNPLVEKVGVSGKITASSWELTGNVENLDVALILPLARRIASPKTTFFNGAQGKTSLDFSVGGGMEEFGDVEWRVDGTLANAAFSSPFLKYPVSEIFANYSIANDFVELRKITASCGQTSIKAAFQRKNEFSGVPTSVARAQFDNLSVNDEVVVRLLGELKVTGYAPEETLDKFLDLLADYRFSGLGNIDVTLENSLETGGNWEPKSVVIDGRNIDALYVGFPYRLDGLAGRLTLDQNKTFAFNLASQRSEDVVKAQGRFDSVFSAPKGQVDIVAKNRTIDSKLLDAVGEENRKTLMELHPAGVFDGRVRISYDPDVVSKEDRLMVETAIDLHDGSILYDAFPMPITSITGSLYMRDGAWVFSNLSGKSGGASFAAAGSLVSGAGYAALGRAFAVANTTDAAKTLFEDGSRGLELLDDPSPAPIERFTSIPAVAGVPLDDRSWRFLLATNVGKFPLGEELRAAIIQEDVREGLEKLRVEGKADGQIRVGYRTDEKKLALQFDAMPIPESTSFQPEGFPFPLSNVEGRVSWREGTLAVSGLRARNGATTCAANVVSQTIPNVGRILDVSELRVDQLQIDRDLQSVATGGFRSFLDFLQPRGFYNVDGAIRVTQGLEQNAKKRVAWNLRFSVQQNSVRPGVDIEGICGRVRTFGVALENAQPLVYGELDVDTLFCKDAQITNLIGPFYYNGADILWGRRAPAIQAVPIYLDPFVRQHVDADPLYRTESRRDAPQIVRGQIDDPAGFTDAQPNAVPLTSNAYGASGGTTPPSVPSHETKIEGGDRPIQGLVFGGQAVSDGVFLGNATSQYRFTTNLQNARLDEMIRVLSPGSKPLNGRVNFNATLQGEGKNIAALKGEGGATVRDAQLYELPQIVKILQVLSVQEPDENAFSSCDVDFKAFGDHVQLSSVRLEGSALSLFGDGWLTIRPKEQLIDLTLSARLGNSKSQIPVVSDVLGAASDQVAQIRVEGNLTSPVIQQERLPGLKKAWWSIFPEQEPEPTDKAPVERSRPVRDAWRKLTGTESKEK